MYDTTLSDIISMLIDHPQRLLWINTGEKYVAYINIESIPLFEELVNRINPLNLFELNKSKKEI